MSKHGPEYQRQRNERYFTPEWVTEALLNEERFYGTSWDSAAGEGHIVKVFLGVGLSYMVGSDIEPGIDGKSRDFFSDDTYMWSHFCGVTNVVTNPPFGHGGRLGMQFIERALQVTERRAGKVAMLLPLTFDAGKTRQHVFGKCGTYAGKYVLTTRIRWANLEQKKAGPMENHAWYLWDHRRNPHADPFVRYI